MMKQTAGVYKLTIGEKFYIGSSINVEARIRQHIATLRAGKSPKKLQEAYDKVKELHVDILEVAPDNMTIYELRELERNWIIKEEPPLNAGALPGKYENSPRGNIDRIEREISRILAYLARYDYCATHKLKMYRALGKTLMWETEHALNNMMTMKEAHNRAGRKNDKNERKKA